MGLQVNTVNSSKCTYKKNISVIYSLEKGSTPTEEGANDTRVKPATQCEGATAFPQHGKVLL